MAVNASLGDLLPCVQISVCIYPSQQDTHDTSELTHEWKITSLTSLRDKKHLSNDQIIMLFHWNTRMQMWKNSIFNLPLKDSLFQLKNILWYHAQSICNLVIEEIFQVHCKSCRNTNESSADGILNEYLFLTTNTQLSIPYI